MAKSTAEAMAAALEMFEAQGVKVTKEMRDALKTAQQSEMQDAALEIFNRKVENGSPEVWVDNAFSWAEEVSQAIGGENVGRGRGMVHEKVFRVETPHGTLKVSLTTEPIE